MFAITDTLVLEDGTYRVNRSRDALVPALDRASGYWVASTNIVAPDASYVGQLIQTLIQDGRVHYVGLWTSSVGRVFVDATHYFPELEDALRAGRHWHQHAIWDNANNGPLEIN